MIRFLLCGVLALLLAAAVGARAQADWSDENGRLILQLGDPDPAVRAEAQRRLGELGDAARAALVRAARGGQVHPTVAAGAAEVLVRLPWYTREDPVAYRVAMRDYARSDPAERAAAVERIATSYPRPVANRILLRILREEPNEDVCWRIVRMLRGRLDAEAVTEIGSGDPPGERASWLTLRGLVLLADDPQRAIASLRRAVELEQRHPTAAGPELDLAFDALVGEAILAQRFDEAAELRRIQSARNRSEESSSTAADPIVELFVLHATHGPVRGFDEDVRTYANYLARPKVLYALALAYARGGDELSSQVAARAAAAMALTAQQRLETSTFLHRIGQDRWARGELHAILATKGPAAIVHRLNAHLYLARLDAAGGDYASAADHVEAALKIVESNGLALQRVGSDGRSVALDVRDLRRSILWRRFVAARDAKDEPSQREAQQHLRTLLELEPRDTEIVLDLIDWLSSQGQQQRADQLFERTYQSAQVRLRASPDDPQILNELAWLCARAERQIDEAVDLATRAVTASPATAAYLDTAAEAQFRAGNFEAAIRLERAAVMLEPDNDFMREQLERFEGGR